MKYLSGNEIRLRFITFFRDHEEFPHAILPSAPLVPQGESLETNATLFNIAGVQPIIPAIMAGEHAEGPRLASAQKCVRTVDLDEVGDATHATFFEMLGNWSIGDYFKKGAIEMSWQLITDTEKGFGIAPDRMFVTVFSGDDRAPRDSEAAAIWSEIFTQADLDPERRIFYKGKDNWWAAGDTGPCGPSTEMFYDLTGEYKSGLTQDEFETFEEEQKIVEIWNDVFMQFEKKPDGNLVDLPKQNVDTGSGLERLTMALQGKTNLFDTDFFAPMMDIIRGHADINTSQNERSARIIADHMKTAVFMASDGVIPGNKDRGYIMRRIIRRAVRNMYRLGIHDKDLNITEPVYEMYREAYPELIEKKEQINEIIHNEEQAFKKTIEKGMREFEKGNRDAYDLFTTYGFPVEMTQELAREHGEEIDTDDFEKKMKSHQESSRTAAAGKFKGGLADDDSKTIALHTAHHLLLAALQIHVSSDIKQRGSNITQERLRIDFAHDEKLSLEQKDAVTAQVNEWITADIPVVQKIIPKSEAENLGAQMEFGAKYPDEVSVYFIGDEDKPVSIEFCGGPHVSRTGELGVFRIKKEESSSAGVRRIKGVLE